VQFLLAGPLVEVGVHHTDYLRGVSNPLVAGQLAWDLGNNWGFSYLLGAYIDVNSEVAWSSTSLNQRFALSYTGFQWNLTANVIWGTQFDHVTGNSQLSPCPAPFAANGCNPDFLNVDLTATRKFGDWEFGVDCWLPETKPNCRRRPDRPQLRWGDLANLSHHGCVREELRRPRHPALGTCDHPALASLYSADDAALQEGVTTLARHR
jgi:hypothetical protein